MDTYTDTAIDTYIETVILYRISITTTSSSNHDNRKVAVLSSDKFHRIGYIVVRVLLPEMWTYIMCRDQRICPEC